MVAKAGYEALMKGEGDVVAGSKNKLQAVSTRVLSDSQLAEMHRAMAERGWRSRSSARRSDQALSVGP